MTVHNIVLIIVSIVAVTLTTASNILARKAYSVQNKKLAKKARLFETIGISLATFALGMAVRALLFT